ncbi:MAG: mechanosensitive ion channel family protein [Candidatus Cloacimonetes bacterium]|nr:mechanosensitive ion channel family protein [Candidatus Cloacimonadota bacterium]
MFVKSITNLFVSYVSMDRLSLLVRVLLMLGLGIPVLRLLRRLFKRVIDGKLSAQAEMLLNRFVSYALSLILIAMILNEFGFKISALLGAAGVLGIAIGFASQTSVSNIISGIFLISEKPFQVGDTVQVEETVGTVISVDLLSIKLKTFDNRFVRLPNENMIKTEVINLTKYDIRRAQIRLRVALDTDLEKLIAVLKDEAVRLPEALGTPAPLVLLDGIKENGIDILYGIWTGTSNVINMQTQMIIALKKRFATEGIAFATPIISLNQTPQANNEI